MRERKKSDGTLAESRGTLEAKLDGIIVGRFVGISESGVPMIDVPGLVFGPPVESRSVVELRPADVDCEVTVMFEGGDPHLPIVIGVIRSPFVQAESPVDEGASNRDVGPSLDLSRFIELDEQDGRLSLRAEREIELKCGNATIVLTKAGKVILHGAYVSSHSTGVNRVKGGSVQIN